MRRWRFPIPLSIVVFLALTLAGTYWVRKTLLERAMSKALDLGDAAMILKLAAGRPSPVNVRGADGQTPLIWAVKTEDLEAARLFLRRGADVNAPNDNGRTPPRQWSAARAVDAK